jgi:hypothetical protein
VEESGGRKRETREPRPKRELPTLDRGLAFRPSPFPLKWSVREPPPNRREWTNPIRSSPNGRKHGFCRKLRQPRLSQGPIPRCHQSPATGNQASRGVGRYLITAKPLESAKITLLSEQQAWDVAAFMISKPRPPAPPGAASMLR